jgi:hypothetical protein
MTERLDQIAAQQATNTANIADLITMSGNLLRVVEANAAAIAELRTNTEILRANAAESDVRFSILIAEMRADRQALNGRIDGLEAS